MALTKMSKPKKKMKYPPGSAISNPLAYVFELIQPIEKAQNGSWLSLMKLKNATALDEFINKTDTKNSLDTIIATYNISRELMLMNFGKEYESVIQNAFNTITNVCLKKQTNKQYFLNNEEINSFKELIEFYDAQMSVATVKDVETARQNAITAFKNKKATKVSIKSI